VEVQAEQSPQVLAIAAAKQAVVPAERERAEPGPLQVAAAQQAEQAAGLQAAQRMKVWAGALLGHARQSRKRESSAEK
jgi:hypothetical protein